MNITNLNELLQTTIINEGSISSVLGFALQISELKQGYAFFSNDEENAELAAKNGAFAIISEKKLKIKDKDIFYLQSPNLKLALSKLLRYISQERKHHFLLCASLELDFARAFGFKVLSGDISQDFTLLTRVNEGFFAFDDEAYLLKFCAKTSILQEAKNIDISHHSLFFTDISCEGLSFKNLPFVFIYASFFAKFITFIKHNELTLHFNDKKLDFLKVFFVDQNNTIKAFGSTQRAFLLTDSEEHFKFLAQKLEYIKGFKIAAKNTLFCDFSYSKLADLKTYKDFRYCLVFAHSEDFIPIFEAKVQELSLFE